MKLVHPRKLALRGVLEAAGIFFDLRWLALGEARQRILSLWTPGAQVLRVLDNTQSANAALDGLLLRFPTAQRLDCARAPGVPLLAKGDVLTAVPLTGDEWAALAAPPRSLVWAQGGVAHWHSLHNATAEALESWLDVSAIPVLEVASLGATPARPQVLAETVPLELRERLANVPPAAAEMADVVKALRQAREGGAAEGAGGRGWRTHLMTILTAVLRPLMTKQPAQKSVGGQAGGESDRRSDWWQRLRMRLLVFTRIASLLGQRQAKYIRRMMEMFESGDVDAALRHAIPLSSMQDLEPKPHSFGALSPRDGLSITPQQVGATSGLNFGEELYEHLRRLYRAAFDRLVAQGRIEEAAFVLAELLQANEEAVSFLERHGKLRLAAEIAEARNLPPGLVVRQWFVAGERERAIQIARRTGAFADAVTRLEHGDAKQAETLRLLWADVLASAGNYAAAVDAIWPVAEGRRLAATWMERVIETGGAAGARMLARKLSAFPESFADVRAQVLALLADERPETAHLRVALADSLRKSGHTREIQTLARATARALLRDAAANNAHINPAKFRELVDFAADGVLRTDLPSLPAGLPLPLQQHGGCLRLALAAADVGTQAITDAAFLPAGRMLVALGEAGALLLSRDGQRLAHFDQPAQRLVLSDQGDRALALAPRGDVWRLARLDLLTRTATAWCEMRLDAWAPDYDGALWFVGADDDFYALDALSQRADALWRVPGVGHVEAVARSTSKCCFLTTDWGTEQWEYELPSLTLRQRLPIRFEGEHRIVRCASLSVSASGRMVDQSAYLNLDEYETNPLPLQLQVFLNGGMWHQQTLSEGDATPSALVCGVDWAASAVKMPLAEGDGTRVFLLDLNAGKIRAEIDLARTEHAALRLSPTAFTLTDEHGRLLVLDLTNGRWLRDLRL
ncbi:MAG: bpX6 domain-containing protein [Acidobacteriota bacterium]